MYVDYQTRQQLIAILTPHVQTVNERRTLVDTAFYGSPICDEIEFIGGARQFAAHLTATTLRHDTVEDGELAVTRLLDTVKHYVGDDKDQEIDALIGKIPRTTQSVTTSQPYEPPELTQPAPRLRRVTLLLALIFVVLAVATFIADERTLALISIIVALIPAVFALMPSVPELRYKTKPIDEGREKMLYNIYQSWIEGILRANLPAGAVDLEIQLQPQAVLRRSDYSEYEMPNSAGMIAKVFDDMDGQLLILGEPGSGKTILLLQLAEHLLGRAQHDETEPIPVVFNLASWGKDQKPLRDWLVDELKHTYGVPTKTGQRWVDNGKLTLLLDGLDEIAPSQDFTPGEDRTGEVEESAVELRSACIEAINSLPQVDIVVCSRNRDYDALQAKLDLNAAIKLSSLTDEQIADYLAEGDTAGIRDLIDQEPTAAALARTPFLLTMMKTAYAGRPYTGSPHNRLKLESPDETARQDHLLGAYAAQRIQRSDHPRYSHTQITTYLRWLAAQMVANDKSVFYIEDLQPRWARRTWLYQILVVLVFGLPVGLVFGLLFGQRDIKFSETITWSFSRRELFFGLVFGLLSGLLFGLLFGLGGGLGGGLVFGLLFGLVFGLGLQTNPDLRVRPNAGLRLSLRNGLFVGLGGGLLSGLVFGLLVGLQERSFWVGDIATTTNLAGTVSTSNISSGLVLVLVGGLVFGLVFGLGGGWLAVIQHIILRITLGQEGVIPRGRYDTFLDHCAALGLLRKVGGGYIFRHRLLLEHFARQYHKDKTP